MTEHQHPDHHQQHHGQHGHDHRLAPGNVEWDAMAARLEFEGESLAPHLDEAVRWARELAEPGAMRRIVDLGSGPGVASARFVSEFPEAAVIAIDGSDGLLERAHQRVDGIGAGDRFSTAVIDLSSADDDAALSAALAGADLVYASMVLHHLPDSAHALAVARAAMSPGGVIIVAEFGSPLRVLPADSDVSVTGVFDRIDAATAHALAEHVGGDHRHDADWSAALASAGFAVVGTRESVMSCEAPLDTSRREWALAHLGRVRSMAAGRFDAADLAALDDLLDPVSPTGLTNRPDAIIHTSRLLVAGRA